MYIFKEATTKIEKSFLLIGVAAAKKKLSELRRERIRIYLNLKTQEDASFLKVRQIYPNQALSAGWGRENTAIGNVQGVSQSFNYLDAIISL